MKIKTATYTKQLKGKTCLVCGDIYHNKRKNSTKNKYTKEKWEESKYCSKKCLGRSKKGSIPWNKGMKGFMSGEKHWSWGKKRKDVAGNNHWNWNGGVYVYRKIVDDSNEKKWVCERCNETSKDKLIVHHKDRNRNNNKIKNLEVLCYKCHCDEHDHFNRWGGHAN